MVKTRLGKLTRHDAATRLVLRQTEFSQARAGPGPQEADIIGDLHHTDGHRVQRAAQLHQSIVGRQSLKFVGSSHERQTWRQDVTSCRQVLIKTETIQG